MRSALALCLLLAACGGAAPVTAAPENALAAAETAYLAAAKLGLRYAALPPCRLGAPPICRDPAVMARIKAADEWAYARLEAARQGEATVEAAQLAIAALTAATPAAQ